MSDLGRRKAVWRKLQAREEERYQEAYRATGNYSGYFTVQSRTDAKKIGEYIAQSCKTCLDVGAGILPRPVYMQRATSFFGLDPFFSPYAREFPFVQAIGESLPFSSGTFEGVSFMSTLDHQIDPLTSLKEAHRVLMPGGLLFLWIRQCKPNSGRYHRWRRALPGGLFDRHHQHAFTEQDIRVLLTQASFSYVENKRIAFDRLRSNLIVGKKL